MKLSSVFNHCQSGNPAADRRAGTDSLMATLSELFDRREGYFANLVEIQGRIQFV